VLWIWIGSDLHHFDGSGSDRHPGHADPDPADPDRYQFQAYEKVDKGNFFPQNFNIPVLSKKILKIMTHLTLMRKIKQCKAVTKKNKKFLFFNMCKTWGRIRTRIGIVLMPIRIRIGINMAIWIRIRIGVRTLPIHNTAE
jgi:hypothetical protein